MVSTPLVSVIIPCFNAESFIEQSIKSVINQTYQNWELLVIDDCSEDKSWQIINSFCKADKRIRSFRTTRPSGSPSHPRNIGISESQGEFIAFLDADDLWLPNKLEEQVYFLLEKKALFVYSNYEKISESGARLGRVIKVSTEATYHSMLKTSVIPCLTVLISKQLVKRRLFKEIGKEDYLLWLEILRSGVKAFNTNKVHALYRERFNSRSGNKFKMLYQQWIILRDFEKLDFLHSSFFLLSYAIKGLIKYIR